VEEGVEKNDVFSLDFLFKNNEKKENYSNEIAKKKSLNKSLRMIYSIGILSPVLSVFAKNNIDSKNELAEKFKTCITEIDEVSNVICERLNIDIKNDSNLWVKNSIQKSFSEYLYCKGNDFEQINLNFLNSLIEQVIKFNADLSCHFEFNESLSEINIIKLACINSIIPVIQELERDSLYRDVMSDLEGIQKKLFLSAKNVLSNFSDKTSNSHDLAKMFYELMVGAGKIYASSWAAESKRISEIISAYDQEKIGAVVEKYKKSGGFPLVRVETNFDNYFNKMIVITNALIKD
jgi:hypothetical protein